MPPCRGLDRSIAFLLSLSSTVSQSDCYVSLSLPTASVQHFRTKTVQNSKNPTWNETFHFTIQSQVKVRMQRPPTAILTRYQASFNSAGLSEIPCEVFTLSYCTYLESDHLIRLYMPAQSIEYTESNCNISIFSFFPKVLQLK